MYVGTNYYSIYIVQLYEASEITRRKKAGFYLLTSSVSSLSVSNNMLDMITLVANEVPMDTYSSLQDPENQMAKLIYRSFRIDHLLASAFLNAPGKVVKISSEILQYRA